MLFMNNKLEQCVNHLKDEIKTVETCLADISNHLASAAEETVGGLEARCKNALAKCEAKREQAGHASQKFVRFLEEKEDELVSRIEDWKTDREIEKLGRRRQEGATSGGGGDSSSAGAIRGGSCNCGSIESPQDRCRSGRIKLCSKIH
jgi:hypothetical protein